MSRTLETLIAVLLASVITAGALQPSQPAGNAKPSAGPSPPTIAPPPCFCRLRVISIHDADTIRADILMPFGVVLPDRAIRAQGFDAHEISRVRATVTITDSELAKGKAAKSALEKLIADSRGLYAVESPDKGVYGRTSAFLYVQQQDGAMVSVAKWAEENGHCRVANEPKGAK